MMYALMKVMYAPLGYIHHDRFKATVGTLSPSMQHVVNHQLLRRFKLSTAIDFSLSESNFSENLVLHWNNLPTVAWLIGCKIARGSLAATGRLAGLPDIARRFISLPLQSPTAPSDLVLSDSDITLLGASYICQLQSHLPTALGQRLPLLFAETVEHGAVDYTLNRSLLTFALEYAQNSRH